MKTGHQNDGTGTSLSPTGESDFSFLVNVWVPGEKERVSAKIIQVRRKSRILEYDINHWSKTVDF